MRLRFQVDKALTVGVSIHASVKDATYVIMGLTNELAVSIHASVKDATPVGA